MKRQVSLLSGIALIVGTMIGSGIFISPKGVLRQTESVGMSLVIWFLCGVLSTIGKICVAKIILTKIHYTDRNLTLSK